MYVGGWRLERENICMEKSIWSGSVAARIYRGNLAGVRSGNWFLP